jgi:hypothetical protein
VGSPAGLRPAAAGSPLTLSSPTEATLLWIIFWRCWAPFEHGIAHPEQGLVLDGISSDGSTPKGLLSIRLLTKARPCDESLFDPERTHVLATNLSHPDHLH